MKSTALEIDRLDAVVGHLPDDGLAASRRTALEQLRRNGVPSTREEDWKYTDLSAAIDIANTWLEAGAASTDTAQPSAITDTIDAHWIVIDNGQPGDLPSIPGADITLLSESTESLSIDSRLGSLNVALLHDGVRITIESDAELDKPIGILVNDHAAAQAAMSQVRVEIDAAPNSQASIIEVQSSAGSEGHFCNTVVNLAIGDGARVDYVRIQERGGNHAQTNHLGVKVGRDATFRHGAFDFGGKLVRNDVAIDIGRTGSRSEFCGLYLVGDGQHIDNHTRVDHRVGPAESHQEYRGILTGKARGVWNGKAIVHEGADGTDAEQSNHNLLLSSKAEINAKPELEIYTDDVKCSHGTTVGQLDETALFYLRSRGLNRHQAKQLLTRAFAAAIVSQSPIESLHEYLGDPIAARLDELMLGADT